MPIPDDVHVRFRSPLGDDLLFHRMHGEEELGRPFSYEVTLLSKKGDLELSDLLGKTVTVELRLPEDTPTPNDKTRYFHGHVTRFSREGALRDYHMYSATIRPWLWFLSQSTNCRIFQDEPGGIPGIIKSVCRDHGFTDIKESLTGDYSSSREFVVQYGESDLNFVSRLMEEHGIYYFFKHEATKHTLVLADHQGAHSPVKGYEKLPFLPLHSMKTVLPDHIDSWEIGKQVRPGSVALKAFNFENPTADMLVSKSAPNPHTLADFENYDYSGDYLERSVGEELRVPLRLEMLNARYEQAIGTGTARGLSTGCVFTLTGAPQDANERQYLVTGTTLTIEGPDYESGGEVEGDPFRLSLAAIDSHRQFRTEPYTPRPTIPGPQTATVVGDKDQEITTDAYGRVKVKFHWDRRKGNKKAPAKVDKNGNDPNSSCWVRVAQMWAGAGFGAINIPRIGDEVIVEFLEGDPDRPIITGRVYNKDHMPPYSLEANKTQTGIKTRSVGKGATPENFNEIRFEDKLGEEMLFIQAEKDQDTLVKHDQTLEVGGDRTITVTGNQAVTISGEGKSPIHCSTNVTGKYTLDASDTIKIQAPTSITLECKGSTIVMEPNKITISAGGGASIVLDAKVLTEAKEGGQSLHDANVLHKSKDGSQVLLDANVLAQSKAGSKVVLDGNALMKTDKNATVQGGKEAKLEGGSGKVTASNSGVEVKGTKVSNN